MRIMSEYVLGGSTYTLGRLECNREHMTLLVEALESGRYLQAGLGLRAGNGYCCLGVGCDISGLGHWEVWEECEIGIGSELPVFAYVIDELAESFYLPADVREWLGVSKSQIMLNKSDDPQAGLTAAKLNDTGVEFMEIAAVLREVYLS
jgi:hypothetical protein